jgi:DNA topoisomerase-6 subunit B
MSKKSKGESATSQSAAEFFSEHQQIAGFDNPGKSLFTTIREFVENSLDAAGSCQPECKVWRCQLL